MPDRRLLLPWTSTLIVAGALAASTFLVSRAAGRAEALKSMTGRLIYSSSTYAAPEQAAQDPRRLIDGDPSTAVPDLNAPARRSSDPSRRSSDNSPPGTGPADGAPWPWNPAVMFVQLQAGLSHFPARPPEPHPLRSIRIWSGNQASPEDFRRHARPRRVRLIYFRQQVVDFDREYRLAGEPVYAGEEVVTLADRMGAQDFPATALAPPQPSERFPHNVRQLWLRLEVLDFYPGTGVTSDAVALSEVAVIRERPE